MHEPDTARRTRNPRQPSRGLVQQKRAGLHVQRQLVVVEVKGPIERHRVAGAGAGCANAEALAAEHAVVLETVHDQELLETLGSRGTASELDGVSRRHHLILRRALARGVARIYLPVEEFFE